jgi:hypothetical protein
MEVKVEVKNAQIDYAKAHLVSGFCFGSVILEEMIRKLRNRLQGRQEQPACNGGVASKKIVLPSQVCHNAMIAIPCFMYLYERAVQDMSCLKVPHILKRQHYVQLAHFLRNYVQRSASTSSNINNLHPIPQPPTPLKHHRRIHKNRTLPP